MLVKREEVFGPVVTVDRYRDFADALAAVNDSAYGLQAGVFTHDLRLVAEAFRVLEVGGVIANDYPTLRVDNYPYGGTKDSGLGREGVRYAMEAMTEPRALVVNLNR
jgi:acyl-CoA reductase-like NAD-dependent aldehyde dehydrogenase